MVRENGRVEDWSSNAGLPVLLGIGWAIYFMKPLDFILNMVFWEVFGRYLGGLSKIFLGGKFCGHV